MFANRAVEDSVRVGKVETVPEFEQIFTKDPDNAAVYTETRRKVAEIMNRYAGIIRSEKTLTEGLGMLEDIQATLDELAQDTHEYYIESSRRLVCVAGLIMKPALMRKESRGGHFREDYPCSDEAFAIHSVQQKGHEITTAPVNSGYFKF